MLHNANLMYKACVGAASQPRVCHVTCLGVLTGLWWGVAIRDNHAHRHMLHMSA